MKLKPYEMSLEEYMAENPNKDHVRCQELHLKSVARAVELGIEVDEDILCVYKEHLERDNKKNALGIKTNGDDDFRRFQAKHERKTITHPTHTFSDVLEAYSSEYGNKIPRNSEVALPFYLDGKKLFLGCKKDKLYLFQIMNKKKSEELDCIKNFDKEWPIAVSSVPENSIKNDKRKKDGNTHLTSVFFMAKLGLLTQKVRIV